MSSGEVLEGREEQRGGCGLRDGRGAEPEATPKLL